jgi:hypothetical protein
VAEESMRAQQGRGKRGVTEHRHHRQWHCRLEEDLETAAGQARVVHGHHVVAGSDIIRRWRDSHESRLPGREHLKRLGPHRRFRAIAADEPVDLTVSEYQGRIAWL